MSIPITGEAKIALDSWLGENGGPQIVLTVSRLILWFASSSRAMQRIAIAHPQELVELGPAYAAELRRIADQLEAGRPLYREPRIDDRERKGAK